MFFDEIKEKGVKKIATDCDYFEARRASLKPCYACNATQRSSKDQRGPIGVRGDDLGWKCFSCNQTGDTVDLISFSVFGCKTSDLSHHQIEELKSYCVEKGIINLSYASKNNDIKIISLGNKKKELSNKYSDGGSVFSLRDGMSEECSSLIFKEEGKEVLEYLKERGFKEEVIKEFILGCFIHPKTGEKYLTIPILKNGKTVNIRFRTIRGQKKYLRCPGTPTELFGADMLNHKNKSVVIVEGELDAIALYQYGMKENIISGTAGASHWKEEWIDFLEKYSHFYIAYDNDDVGSKGARTIADKLGLYRCSRVIFPENDAAQCLKDGISEEDIKECFESSQSLMKTKLLKVSEYADEIEDLVRSPEELIGRCTGSTKLDKAIGGIRNGLTIVTGGTGQGKTTLATWLAYNQACFGNGVLLTSFEQRPIGTVQKLLRVQIGGVFTLNSEEERRYAMGRLGKMPLYILDHYGNIGFSEIMNNIKYAIRRRDVKLIVVDHLGYLINPECSDERREIENCIRQFATLSIQEGVNIMLICHPNRVWVGQQRRVRITDLKGASAIEQDAHCGIVVERLEQDENNKFPRANIHVDKCRSEFGVAGSTVTLSFDQMACSFGDSWEDTPSGQKPRSMIISPEA